MTRPLSSYALFNPGRRSLVRGNLLVLASFAAAVRMSDFPRSRATLLLIIPVLTGLLGTFDTIRCIQRRWNLYHAGVVLCVYMDLLAMSLILFFLFGPYVL